MMRPARWKLALVAIALLAAACGSSGDPGRVETALDAVSAAEPAEPDEPANGSDDDAVADPEAADTPAAEPDPDESPEPAADPDPTPTLQPSTAPALESVYDLDMVDGGWPVTAGSWTSHSFSTPLMFELPVDAVLVSDGLGRLEFAIGPEDDRRGVLRIVEPVAVSSPGGPIPIDLVSTDNALTGATVLNEAFLEGPNGEIAARDIRMEDVPILRQFASRCYDRPENWCLNPLITNSGDVTMAIGIVHRFTTRDWGEEGRLYVTATAVDPEDSVFRDHADSIAVSAVAVDSEWTGTRAIGALGTVVETLAPGSYVRRVGEAVVALELPTELAAAKLVFLQPDVLGIELVDGSGYLWITSYDDRYDLETGDLVDPVRRPGPIASERLEATMMAGGLSIDTAQQSTFGGLDSIWYDTSVVDGTPCPPLLTAPPAGSVCASWTATSRSLWFAVDTTDSRYEYVEAAGLLVSYSPGGPASYDDFVARIQPVLDGLSISAIK